MKTCKQCGSSKELTSSYFYPSKYTEDGYSQVCRACEVFNTHKQYAPKKVEHIDVHEQDVSLRQKRELKRIENNRKKREVTRALKDGHKACVKCGETKRLFDFSVDKKTYTGYSSWCKPCKKEARV
jgi:thiol-disulfide isomerase/thioredoxin